jgi:hypothetical protein
MNRNTISCSAFLSRLGRLCALAVAGLFAATATANPYLTFSSADTFTITPQEALWDGTLEYSTDATTWTAFDTAGAAAADDGSGTHKLHLRGTGNTRISSASANAAAWTLTASADVACEGNIETLLDYAKVINGEHPAMEAYCFINLFKGWTKLTNAPALPATTLATYCYAYMFQGCTGLTAPPALPATTLAPYCYGAMFWGCTGLTQTPALPATNLAAYCYYSMFQGCTGLTQPPALPATALADYCYRYMFQGCTGLTQAPELPATTLARYCYSFMFQGCTGLTNAPALPAMALAYYCYAHMFLGCTGLTAPPVLPATDLANHDGCYRDMFHGCTGISLHTQGPGTEWSIPAGSAKPDNWNYSMFYRTSGTFTGSPQRGTTYYYVSPDSPRYKQYLTFSSAQSFTIKPQEKTWTKTIEYSTDAANWAAFTAPAGAAAADDGSGTYKLYLRGTGNTRISDGVDSPGWTLTAAGTVACSGNIETLLDYKTVGAAQHPAMTDYCFANLFKDWTALTDAPALPATALANYCYAGMFRGCTGLTNAPALPATALATRCYYGMFQGCTGLAQAPALPATALASSCYYSMFQGCTGLTQPPALPATALASACYSYMFQGCTGLAQAPALPATALADGCYYCMFRGCTGLTLAPALPATTLADYCYFHMFEDCTGLTQPPALPATALAVCCYEAIFKGCTGIKLSETGPGAEWGIPAAATAQWGWHNGMFTGTGGTFRQPGDRRHLLLHAGRRPRS